MWSVPEGVANRAAPAPPAVGRYHAGHPDYVPPSQRGVVAGAPGGEAPRTMEFLRSTTSRRPAWALACSGLLLFGAAATTSFAESSMFRYSPTHAAALASASVELAGMAWRFETGGAVRSTPAVTAGTIVFGSNDGNLYALDLKTGVQKWKVRFGGEVSGSPAIFDGKIIAMRKDDSTR